MSRAWSVRLAAIFFGAGALACSRGENVPDATRGRVAELQRAHEAFHDSLDALVAGDTLIAEAVADSGEVVLAIRASLVEDLIHEVTASYLDRVELDLSPNVQVQEGGEVRVKALFARITAGAWRVNLTIHRIRGVLAAKTPEVSVTRTNRIHLALPVVLQQGSGTATLRFAWDAKSVANVVCRDFATTQRITGSVLPREYEIEGDFVLTAGERSVVARPEFPEEKFRLSVDLSPESWANVQRTLASQDKISRCGIALAPADVIRKLQALGRKGFNVKLPRSIFRTVELPASVSRSVEVEERRLSLAVRPNVLRVTPRTFWYSSAVRTEIAGSSPDTLGRPGELREGGG